MHDEEKQRDDQAAADEQPEEPEGDGQPEAALADEVPTDEGEQPIDEAAPEEAEEPADQVVEETPADEDTEPAETAVDDAEPETAELDEDAEAETPAASQPARRRASQREQAPEGIPALFGRKLGMLQVFDEAGTVQNVTALELGPCVVTMVRTPQRDGYSAIQLGWGQSRELNKPASGHLAASGGDFRYLREVRVDDSASFGVGQEVTTSIFQPGERVDVTSTSKGRGFAGGVKRHGFHGGPKTHGQSDRHRAPGSIGAGTTPGHVLKGQKMAGHMGARQVTVRSLVVVKSDNEKNLLLVRGSVPGPVNGLVRVKRTTRVVTK